MLSLPWRRSVVFAASLLVAVGCERKEQTAETNFYQRRIGPILERSCAEGPAKSGCHVRADDKGNALGNLSLSSYDDLVKRRDLLLNYGPYGMPGLLVKVAPDFKLALTNWKSTTPLVIDSHIAHQGGSPIDITSTSFTQLQTWMENGAAENNARQADKQYATSACSDTLGTDPAFDPDSDPAAPDFATFEQRVNSVLGESCAASNCHGSPSNSLQLTCGTSPEQVRWNYFATRDYVSSDSPLSELVRRPLAASAGGAFHEGGTIFGSTADAGYQALLDWATEKGGPTTVDTSPGFEFFTERVQPMLVRRGCMMLGCHSSSMFHDYRLRGGSGGHFGLPATRKNYELTLEQLALDAPNPEASRLVRKNLAPAPDGPGILHRGGPLLAEHPAVCDEAASATGPLDEQSEYCVIASWIELERQARMPERGLTGIVFVRRSPAPGRDWAQDYGTFAGGAELVRVAATEDPTTGAVTVGAEESLSALCSLPATADVRRPTVSWDGKRIAFSARTAEAEPLGVYLIEGASCELEPTIAAAAVDESGAAVPDNGELVHNFDPVFSADGRLVFVSTRGNVNATSSFPSYSGPQRTPADPSKLNANLYVLEGGKIRQMTFLLNQELSPSFMRDGRLIMVTEKRQPGFYQLAGRRMNMDGGDYHPLFGQRGTIGFNQFTDVVELSDKNLAAIFSERGAAHGAGALGLVNRSLGIDQRSDDPAAFVQDPAAIDYPSPDFYQHSIRILDPAATGKLSGTQGAYRSPSPLPNGDILVSYAANVVALDDFSGNFDVVAVNSISGERTPLVTGALDELWPAAIYPRSSIGIFESRLDEANGATRVDGDPRYADVTFLDVNMIASLLFQNTRSGRPLGNAPALRAVWESFPPQNGTTFAELDPSFVTSDDFGQVYSRRQLLGAPDLYADGSAAMRIRGGTPILLELMTKLADDAGPTPHLQREEMQFYPGEVVRQGFRRELFDGMCGGCHGSVSGKENEIAANPDILTQASDVIALRKRPTDLSQASGEDTGP
jgi:WD40-like Beta Propeller Repeat